MKNYILIGILLMSLPICAQNINFNPDSMDGTGWIGFMNVSNLPAPYGDGAYQFGGGWGTADLVAEDNMDGTVTLKPNRIGDPDVYWQGSNPPGNPTGNKMMDATYYLENDALAGQDFTFNARVVSNTLNSTGLDVGFTVIAFIKVFAPDYSSNVVVDSYDLSEGNFTLVHNASDSSAGDHVQYGFTVVGPNVRLDTDAEGTPGYYTDDYDALGGITVGPNTLSTTDYINDSDFIIYPNPTMDIWNVKTNNQEINSIEVFDIQGKQTMSLTPNAIEAKIDGSSLPAGLYFATINTINGSKSIKLIKQ